MADYATPYDISGAGCGREAFDVRFSYYSPEEIRKVSVKQVTSVDAFSEVGTIPTPSGLHAQEMGPLKIGKDKGDMPICPTCGLDKDCPGHLGHIDLACPCYNPFLFLELFKLLRRTCLECHCLKIKKEKTQRVVRTLLSLTPGGLAQSAMIPVPDSKAPLLSDAGPSEPIMWFEEDASTGTASITHSMAKDLNQQATYANFMNDGCLKAIREAENAAAAGTGDANFTESACLESFRAVLDEYRAEIPMHCANCGAKGAKWRKDGYSKLFVQKGKRCR